MTTFTNTPPKDPRGPALRLLRTPSVGTLRAIVTSEDLVGTFTHFWRGRTLPHNPDKCEACQDGFPFRWHAWLSAVTENAHEHVLFEMTPQACEHFVLYRQAHNTLRGCLFNAWRPSGRPNGRVFIKVRPANLTDINLPDAPDLLKLLSMIWNVPFPAIDVDRVLKGVPHATIQRQHSPIPSNDNGRR